MKFIHFIDKLTLNSVIKNGITKHDCYRGNGILVYPEKDILFRSPNSEPEFLEEEKKLNKLSHEEKWKVIGALKFRQEGITICGVIIELTDQHWPLKVFIDIKHQIAKKFGKLLDEFNTSGIQYSTGETLTKVVNRINVHRYTLEGSFIVNSEKDLIKLIELFQKAGGGIWEAHSFDCMIDSDVSSSSIIETIELENKY